MAGLLIDVVHGVLDRVQTEWECLSIDLALLRRIRAAVKVTEQQIAVGFEKPGRPRPERAQPLG